MPLWFTLQTVTTVGYGDATPTSAVGKIVAAVVMLSAIGLITVLTSAITSVFVAAARSRADRAEAAAEADVAEVLARLEVSLDHISRRLERLERAVAGEAHDPEPPVRPA